MSVSAENVISRNAVAVHFPDIDFTTRKPSDLYSDKAAGAFQLLDDDPKLHLGRFLGYDYQNHNIVLNAVLDIVVWPSICKKFDHPMNGSSRDFERLRLKGCEHLFDSMPLLEGDDDA